MKERVADSLTKLLHWIDLNGNDGYDPYDVYDKYPILLNLLGDKTRQSLPRLGLRYAVHQLNLRSPVVLRKMLGVRPMHHATFYGNMMQCHVNLSSIHDRPASLRKSSEYRSWLLANAISGYSGHCWGTPFAWRSGTHTYKTGVPFAVVCAWIGDAFYRSWQATEDEADLQVCRSICSFFVNDLPRTTRPDGSHCFSYSPDKVDQIHNANLFVAEFLHRIGFAIEDETLIHLAESAVRFTLDDQFESGLIPYYASDSEFHSAFNDSYHGSYEMRMLHAIWSRNNSKDIESAIVRYLAYFKKSYLNPDGGIATKKDNRFPVDVTALADTIVLFTHLGASFGTHEDLARLLDFCLSEMQDPSGYFYYRKVSANKFSRIPYIRWSQGWMALALSEYLRYG